MKRRNKKTAPASNASRSNSGRETNCLPRNLKGAARSDQLLIAGLVIVIVASLVVIGSVCHSWKGKAPNRNKWSCDASVESLQAQINALKQEIAKNKTGAASPTANQNESVSQTASAVFEKAVNDKDFSKIETLMATRVYYVIDASDCCGDIPKKEAAANLKNYIRDAKSFNFDQNQQVVKQMKVNLADTFAKYTIGIADSKMVLSYHLDNQGKVDDLMLSATHLMYDLE